MGDFELIVLRVLREKYPDYSAVLLAKLASIAPYLLVSQAFRADPPRFVALIVDMVECCGARARA